MDIDKLIVTNKSALISKYGSKSTKIISALNKLIAKDKERGMLSRLVFLDEAGSMKSFQSRVVKNPSIAKENKNAIDDPGDVEPHPYPIGQFDLRTQHRLEKTFLEYPYRYTQGNGNRGVQHGWFPLDETFILQPQRQGAKHHNQCQRDFLHRADLAVDQVDGGGLRHCGRHQNRCCNVDVVELVGCEKKHYRKEVEQDFHALLKSSDAEFMQ